MVGRLSATPSLPLEILSDHVMEMHSQIWAGLSRPPVRCARRHDARAENRKSSVLFDRDKNFSSSVGWGYLLDQLFPRGLMLMDFDEHRLHRKALGVAFKPAPMKAYLGALNNGMSRRIAEWHLAGTEQGSAANLKFYPAIKQLTLDLAATSFLGIELGPQANAVNRAFVDMVAAIVGVVRRTNSGNPDVEGRQGT